MVDLPGPKLRTGPLAPQPTSDKKGDYLRLGIGDRLLLMRDADVMTSDPGRQSPARIGCSLSEAFTVTRRGHHVWLDDGKLGGIVEAVDHDGSIFRITSAGARAPSCTRARASTCPTPSSTSTRSAAQGPGRARHVAGIADLVGLSFVRHPADVERAQRELDPRGRPEVGVLI